EGVGATAAALVDLSTVAGNKISNPPWVKFQSAGWVNFPSAPTPLRTAESKHHFRISPFTTQQRPEGLVDGSALNASPEMTKAAS
ncbi:hypothetical protein L4528_32270, partial [Pseudomonas aeruginosa]|uniref:hypothetical protein n=1 Tax=Pseudomonas aeruginosa TaxID=287 RepID=UPI001F433CEA